MNETTQQEKTAQLGSRIETTQQEKTTQLSSRNETTQLNRRKQLNSSVRVKQLNSALPSTACTAFTAESAFSTYSFIND
ncbi:hypothetical protein TNCV_2746421 [Trichonephila clavipes]|nr:hypothetical protein TNCV_2746421 [Trichonephila clavipes]